MKPAFLPVDPQYLEAGAAKGIVRSHVGRFGGHSLKVTYELQPEHKDRVAAGLGAITDERLLDALVSLPSDDLAPIDHHLAILLDEPEAAEHAIIVDDPEGGRWAQRRRRSPVKILELELRVRSWARGRALAHDWVGYGPRVVHLSHGQEDVDFLLIEAANFGIGVRTGDREANLLAPKRFAVRRWTSAQWLFAEQVYDQYLAIKASGAS